MCDKVFILANPRSGSSLLRIMLNSHTRIVAPPEAGFLQWWHDKYKEWSLDWNYDDKIEEYIADLQSSRKIETWGLNFDEVKNVIAMRGPATYGDLTASIYLSYAKSKSKQPRVIVDKNNYYIFHLSTLAEVWPDAKYILLVRDGRDVACSYKALADLQSNSPYRPKLPVGIVDIANEWKVNNERILSFFESLPSAFHYTLRYEDLILSTEEELTRLCDFLGVTFEASMLSFHISNRLNEDEPKSTLDWKRMTLQEPDPGNIGKYRNELDAVEIEEFNTVASAILGKFGYG